VREEAESWRDLERFLMQQPPLKKKERAKEFFYLKIGTLAKVVFPSDELVFLLRQKVRRERERELVAIGVRDGGDRTGSRGPIYDINHLLGGDDLVHLPAGVGLHQGVGSNLFGGVIKDRPLPGDGYCCLQREEAVSRVQPQKKIIKSSSIPEKAKSHHLQQ